MVDSLIEVYENYPAAHYLIEVAKRIPNTGTIDIQTNIDGIKKVYSLNKLLRHFFTDIVFETNINNDPPIIFEKGNGYIFIRTHINDQFKYNDSTKAVLGCQYITGKNHPEIFKINYDNFITNKEFYNELNSEMFIAHSNFLDYPKIDNFSVQVIKFSPDKSQINTSFVTHRRIIYEKYFPEPPLEKECTFELDEKSFSLLKKKTEIGFRASMSKEGLCNLLGIPSRANESISPELIEVGKSDILNILNHNLEGIDLSEFTKGLGFIDSYKKLYLGNVIGRIKFHLRSTLEEQNYSSIDNFISEYNKKGKIEGWKKIDRCDLIEIINKI